MKKADLVIVGLCCAWLVALVVLAGASSAPLLAAMRSENAADWTSAVATFGAVIVALGIAVAEGLRSNAAEKRAREQRTSAAALRLRHLLVRLLSLMSVAQQSVQDSSWSETEADLTEQSARDILIKLEALDLGEFPPHDGYVAAAISGAICARAATAICELGRSKISKGSPKLSPDWMDEIVTHIDQVLGDYELLLHRDGVRRKMS